MTVSVRRIVPSTLVVEDVLMLALHEAVGPPATAATLLHTLGGAVLVDLALLGRIGAADPVQEGRADGGGSGRGGAVVALGHGPPADPLLRSAHDIVARRPRPARSLVPEIGAELRGPVTGRLVERGRIRRERRRPLGLYPVTTRAVADVRHEADLRAHLVNGSGSGRV